MKLVLVSDTHTYHQRLSMPPGDVFVHAGDSTFDGSYKEVWEFNEWLGTLPYKHKVVVAGNHDFLFERAKSTALKILTNAVYLEDSLTVADGLRIYGSPWTPTFGEWAFMLDRHALQLKMKWDAIPQGIDVLVTHGPPYGIGDLTPDGQYVGCAFLADAVKRVKPKVHVYGHVHHGHGVRSSLDTRFVNASIVDESYTPIHSPIVLEV